MKGKSALKEAKRRWPNETVAVRDGGPKRASTPQRRGEAFEAIKALRQSLGGQRPTREQRAELDRLFSESQCYRYSVGYISFGIAFHVAGVGDTWEGAFADVDAKRAMFRKAA